MRVGLAADSQEGLAPRCRRSAARRMYPVHPAALPVEHFPAVSPELILYPDRKPPLLALAALWVVSRSGAL
jgi:hypothetical protein